MPNFESLPQTEGERRFRAEETAATEGMPERAKEAQRKAALKRKGQSKAEEGGKTV